METWLRLEPNVRRLHTKGMTFDDRAQESYFLLVKFLVGANVEMILLILVAYYS